MVPIIRSIFLWAKLFICSPQIWFRRLQIIPSSLWIGYLSAICVCSIYEQIYGSFFIYCQPTRKERKEENFCLAMVTPMKSASIDLLFACLNLQNNIMESHIKSHRKTVVWQNNTELQRDTLSYHPSLSLHNLGEKLLPSNHSVSIVSRSCHIYVKSFGDCPWWVRGCESTTIGFARWQCNLVTTLEDNSKHSNLGLNILCTFVLWPNVLGYKSFVISMVFGWKSA